MNAYYYGRIGKDHSFGLLASKRIVVWSKSMKGFVPFDSITEAERHVRNPAEDKVYFCDNGEWKEVDFLVEGGGGKAIRQFTPG